MGPYLAGNSALGNAQAVITRVLAGGGNMPPFRARLSDEEIAAVVTYVRTSWGNSYGPVTASDVAALR
ncbi:MAG: cytochrome c [Bauldia sp.]|nr:cytochrome c [Bauldia sp.]